MKQLYGIIIFIILLYTAVVPQQKQPLPFWVAYTDGKAYILLVDVPRNTIGFNVYRKNDLDFELLNTEIITSEKDPLMFREMMGEDYQWIQKAVKSENELQTLRRIQSDPGIAFAFSLTNLKIAKACGRLFIDSTVQEENKYTYRIAYIDADGKEFKFKEKTIKIETIIPFPPSKVQAEAGDAKVKISWDYPTYTANLEDLTVGFNIYRKLKDDNPIKINSHLILRQEGLNFRTDNEVENGKEYIYFVTAVDFIGRESKSSNTITVLPKDNTAPQTPAGLVATPEEGKIILDWKMNLEPDLSHYDIYRGFSSQGEFSKININPILGGKPTFTDSNLIFGPYYFYKICAVDLSGNESKYSAVIPARPKDTKSPTAPTNLSSKINGTFVTLTWKPSTDDDLSGYYVYRSFNKENLLRVVGTPIGKDTLNYYDAGYQGKGLWPGKTYYYAVSSVDVAQNESPKSILAVTIPDHEAPQPPFDINVFSTVNGNIMIRWQPSTSLDVASYRIYRNMQNESTMLLSEVNGFTFTDSSVIRGQTYSYQITAVDSSGNESIKTNSRTVTSKSIHLPPSPAGIKVISTKKGFEITWDSISDKEVIGYNIYRSDQPSGMYEKLNEEIIKPTQFTDVTEKEIVYYKITTVTASGYENKSGKYVVGNKQLK